MESQMKAQQIVQLQHTKAGEQRFFQYVTTGIIFLLVLLLAGSATAQTISGKHFNNVDASGVILDGYDAVAFFTDNKPVKGDAAFSFNYEDATYLFASQQHLDLFKANPANTNPSLAAGVRMPFH